MNSLTEIQAQLSVKMNIRKIIIGIVLVVVGIMTFGFFTRGGLGPPPPGFPGGVNESTKDEEKFITANPLDLSEISSLSKFRSCMGHDYSGKNTSGETETNRSMKHYITLKEGIEKAKAFAPFDGEVSSIEQPERGYQVWLKPDANSNFAFIFFHLEPQVKKGDKVKAGEQIGYGLIVGEGGNFDMTIKGFEGFGGPKIFDSPFYHMTDEVLSEYQQKGITLENIIISKDNRDKNPCTFGQGSGQNEQVSLK